MLSRTLRTILATTALALIAAACGGGGGTPTNPDPGPGTQPPAVTFDSQETDANGEATLEVAGSTLTLTFVDDLTDEPIEGLFVDIAENDEDSVIVVSDGFGEFATYAEFIDPASFSKIGVGRTRRPAYLSDGTFGVPYIDDLMVGVPGVLSYVNPEIWEAWLEEFADFDGDATLAGLDAWLVDLIEEETTAEVIQVIGARPLSTAGVGPTWALLSGAATYEEISTTPWLSVWTDWYAQGCYDGSGLIAVYVTLYEGLLTVFLWPVDDPPESLPATYPMIAGTVTDAETRQPIADAAVVPTHLWMESLTDLAGDYSLSDVQVVCDRYDDVVFVVEAFGYFPYGFTGGEAGLNGTTTAVHDVELEPAIPWTFYGPAEFVPGGTWSLAVDFSWFGSELHWGTFHDLTAAYDLLEAPLDLQVGDRIELEYRYFGHSDVQGRQKVLVGFTDVRDATGGWPANFVGLSTAGDDFGAETTVVLSKGGVASEPFSIAHARNVVATFRLLVIVESATTYRLIVDQDGVEQHNSVRAGNLVGTTMSQCAIWNAPTGADPLLGAWDGDLLSVRWRGLVN